MKHYTYYPGCSIEATAVGLGMSIRAIAGPLELGLMELEGWTCCGTIPYSSLDSDEATLLAAHNLALAEKTGLDLVTPCTGCFVVLATANRKLKENAQLMGQVNQALAEAGMAYRGSVRVRLLTEVLVNDVTAEFLATKGRGLNHLRVAPYYGCQLVRPNFGFDHPEDPRSLDKLVNSLGAVAVSFPMKARCCGGSLVISEEDMALGLVYKLLRNAVNEGAQCVVTPCPLCQMNLDAFQGRVNSRYGTRFNIPVLFLPQLIGLALGADTHSLGLKSNIVSPRAVLEHISGQKQEVGRGA